MRLSLAALILLIACTPPRADTPPAHSPAAALRWSAGQTFSDCNGEPWCPQMVVLPAGSFTMGSPDTEQNRNNDEGPQRVINIPKTFAVSRREVTVGQYAAFVAATRRSPGAECWVPHPLTGDPAPDPTATWRNPGFAQSDDHPVVCVSWEDAQAYVRWLNTQTPGGYRLLTEAEWEYAARAGVASAYLWGGAKNEVCRHANGRDASYARHFPPPAEPTFCDDGSPRTTAVGSYRPNAFGLYDMIGNVAEWTQDCYEENLSNVPADSSANLSGPCSSRDYRGGSWNRSATDLRLARRNSLRSQLLEGDLGFRVAKTLN